MEDGMIQLTSREFGELERSIQELTRILATLDELGAGIAGIHVSAAIEQLNKNLEAIVLMRGDGTGAFFFPEASG